MLNEKKQQIDIFSNNVVKQRIQKSIENYLTEVKEEKGITNSS